VLSHHPSGSSPCFSQNRPPTRWLVWGKLLASLWLALLVSLWLVLSITSQRLANRASQRLASGLPQTNHLVGSLFWLKHGEEPLGWCDSTVYVLSQYTFCRVDVLSFDILSRIRFVAVYVLLHIHFVVIRFVVIRFVVIHFVVIRFVVICFVVIRFVVIRFVIIRFVVAPIDDLARSRIR